MKHRITYLLHDGEPGIDPSTVQVTPDSITTGPTKAAQEWRVTVGLLDLPNEVIQLFEIVSVLYTNQSAASTSPETKP